MRLFKVIVTGVGLAGVSLACVQAYEQAPAKATAAPAAAPASASLLPAGPGRDTMIRVCSTCHSPEMAAVKRLDPQGWYDVVQFMSERGAAGSEAEMAEITEYLARSFPKDAPASPAPT